MIRRIQEVLSRFWAIFRRRKLDDDFAEELSAHIDLLTEENQRRGLSPDEARRQAILRLGGLNATTTLQRQVRGIPVVEDIFQASWLDFKLGARMLVKYPGLAVVGGLAMAIAVAIGATTFDTTNAFFFPTLPIDEGERVIAIENWDAAANDNEPQSLRDFVTWRAQLKSVEDLGVFRTISRNLIVPGRSAEQVAVAEMSASGFRVARTPAVLGRPLVDDDERIGALEVVVIGYDIWQTRFAGDPSIIGQTVRLGGTAHTVVGIMHDGFAFPVDHRFWVPFRANPADYERRGGPEINVFGRLAPGATLDVAQAELATIGLRTADAFPETHRQLRPRLSTYTALWVDEKELWQVQRRGRRLRA